MGSGLVNFPASTGGYPRKLLMNSQGKKDAFVFHGLVVVRLSRMS